MNSSPLCHDGDISKTKREKSGRLPALSEFCSIKKLLSLIHGPRVVEDDMCRWFSQGFTFCESPNFGLKQGSGGPCGVLAVVQSEILKRLFFNMQSTYREDITNVPISLTKDALIKAFWEILTRCKSGDQICLIDCPSLEEFTLRDCSDLLVHEIYSEDDFYDCFTSINDSYRSGFGCFFFLLSVVATRGIESLRGDMDDAESSLIGQFGHCTQELMNLLLTGEATSNVFDGQIPMIEGGDGTDQLMLKGVRSRAEVGYLSQLEALRYCEVGNFLKVPRTPVWVVGSSSHFTVLFSLDRRVNEESGDEALLAEVQRAFRAVDSDNCGFILENQLSGILETLGVTFASNPTDVQRLNSFIQLDGGIILWSTFWEKVSLLLTGTPLEDVLSPATAPSDISRPRSDSEIARELQAGFDESTSAVAVSSRPRSDSEIARQMQDEWNSPEGAVKDIEEEKLPTASGRVRHRSDSIASKHDENFVMYHYNGFDGVSGNRSQLCRFVMYRRSADESIGQSVAMVTSEANAFTGHDILPIEEVMRTRWPGCRLDFLGQTPPKLD